MPARVEQTSRRVGGQVLQGDRNVNAWNSLAGALRPFDQYDCLVGHDLVPRDVRELRRTIEPIEIEMVHGRRGRIIAMHEREGWTRHFIAHTIATTDCLNEGR